MASFITLKSINISRSFEDDRRADDQRVIDALNIGPIEIPLDVLKKIHGHTSGEFSCVISTKRQGRVLRELENMTSVVGDLYDIRERKVVISALNYVRREGEEIVLTGGSFQALIEGLDVALVGMDKDGKVNFVNPCT